MIVGQGSTALAADAGGACLDILLWLLLLLILGGRVERWSYVNLSAGRPTI